MNKKEIFDILKKDRPQNKDNTINSSTSSLYCLLKKGYDLNNFDETRAKLLNDFSNLNTLQTTLKNIIVFTKAQKIDSKLYTNFFNEIKEKVLEKRFSQEKTITEKANMVTSKEFKNQITKYKKLVNKFPEDIEILKRYVVLNLYHLIPPLRSDFANLLVDPDTPFDNKHNYIFLKTKKLVLNEYKTFRKYGQKTIDLPTKLIKIIKDYLKKRVEIDPKFKDLKGLFYDKHYNLFTPPQLEKLIRNAWDGKNISVNILRKSYLTEKYPVTKTTKEMQEDADKMGHSISTQQTVYRKKE